MQGDGSNFASLLIVLVAGVVSVLLLVQALVCWMAEWFGSIVQPSLIVGGGLGLVSFAIYRLHLRALLSRMQERLVAVGDMIRLVREGADIVISLLFGRGKQ